MLRNWLPRPNACWMLTDWLAQTALTLCHSAHWHFIFLPILSPKAIQLPHLSPCTPSYLVSSPQFMGSLKYFHFNWENKLSLPSLSPGRDSQPKCGVEGNANPKNLVCLGHMRLLNISSWDWIWVALLIFQISLHAKMTLPPSTISTCNDFRTLKGISSL